MSSTVTSRRRPPAASPWPAFLLSRGVGLLVVLLVLIIGTFLMVQLVPGDPAQVIAGPDATPAQVAQIRADYGLDRPVLTQLVDYVGGVLRGDLGTSFSSGQPVSTVVADRLPLTAEVALLGIVVVLVISVPLGMAVAVLCSGGRRRGLDTAFSSLTAAFGAIPEYVLATLLVYLLAIRYQIFPAAGAGGFSSLILLVAAVSVGPICTLARVVRRETAVVLSQDYMRTARGRRLATMRLYARHALPNLLTSTLTLGGLILTSLLGGVVVVELVFAWPGLGLGVLDAIVKRDYPVIQGIVLVLGVLATLLALLVDIVLGLIDPRTLQSKAVEA